MDPYQDHNRKILSPLDKKNKEEAAAALQAKQKTLEDTPPSRLSEKGTAATSNVAAASLKPGEPGGDGEGDDLAAHLIELRKQLIKSIAVFLLFFAAALSTINLWFPYITRGYDLIVLSPMEVVSFYTTISAALAFGFSVPFLCHFLWQFVKTGLNEKERGFLGLYSPAILVLFAGGLAFGYFVVNPLSYNFLVKLGEMNFDVMVSAKEYARFLLLTTMPIGLLFELPVVALFLSAIGILTSGTLKKVRKWSYVVLAVLSALITPPDFFSQLIILVPMIGLYEVSIHLVVRSERRQVNADLS
ncbi:twin-arginine translocase subunit TatC [Sporosarcina koreensis]|uniref:twin-arginine translocase subunit TatC n=1 Tax=Sporosarcina koreensis TaxID=334735 RepID=UPI00058E05B6|nr:twin-arginine translocase subunit TatC [Sporosarcina koreensis]